MNMSIVIVVISLVVFAIGYFSKKRLGLPILGLAAGALIAQQWGGWLTIILQQQGVNLIAPPLVSVVTTALILAPAFLLIIVGGKESSMLLRILDSTVMAIVTAALLVVGLGTGGDPLIDEMSQYARLAVGAGLIVAIVTILLSHRPRKKG